MPRKAVPVYKGDPRNCAFCISGEYPHSHDVEADARPAAPSVAPNRQVDTYTGMPRRRGRPMKEENWELLRLCECE